jgi:hypothetical protein
MDPRLMGMIGKKLYSTHPLPIIVRELMQNAIYACIRRGVEPKIKITIARSKTSTEVICEDNGIGMTEEQILSDFLCLGNTSSALDQKAVGGFGVAKAALLRNPEWSCHSLDNYVDQEYFTDECSIQKRPMREGTEVRATIDERVYEWTVKYALAMVYLSDVDVHLTYTLDCIVELEDAHAGFQGKTTQLQTGDDWTASGIASEVLIMTDVVENRNFFRIKGLLQYETFGVGDRKLNIIIDLDPVARPDSDEYPFNMSREGLTTKYQNDILDAIRIHDENPISAEQTVAEGAAEQKPYEIFKGHLLRGKRGVLYAEQEYRNNNFADVLAAQNGEANIVHTYENESMLFKHYDHTERDIVQDSKVLQAWKELLLMIACKDDNFGIGLVCYAEKASRSWVEGDWFYLIDPDALHKIPTLQAKAYYLYNIALHEVTHFSDESHNERFTVRMLNLMAETVGEFMQIAPKLVQILK